MSSEAPETSNVETIFAKIKNFFTEQSPVSDKNRTIESANNSDFLSNLSKEKIDQEVNKIIASETGIERVKRLFSYE